MNCSLIFCYPMYTLVCFRCGHKVYVIRIAKQLDINLLSNHLNHVKKLLAIPCEWD